MLQPRVAPACFGFACVMSLVTPLAARQPVVAGVVKTVTANAVIVRAGQELPATVGQPVYEGDTIKTGGDGRLGLTLKDGTRLSLGANTELRVDAFAYAPAERRLGLALRVIRGVTAYVSGHIARLAPGAVKIETPRAVIGVRGTHLLVEVPQP